MEERRINKPEVTDKEEALVEVLQMAELRQEATTDFYVGKAIKMKMTVPELETEIQRPNNRNGEDALRLMRRLITKIKICRIGTDRNDPIPIRIKYMEPQDVN